MAENSIFNVINMKAGDQQRSYTWYRNQVRNLATGVSGVQLLKNEQLSSRVMPGEMYLFMYDPKNKETLPYYDVVPLVLPFRRMPDGFLGINLHYLPYLARFNLLRDLNTLARDSRLTNDKRLMLSWQLLNSSSKYLSATACVKHYLNAHLRSRFLKINYDDWITAAMLHVENFQKAKKEKVWADTKQKYGN